MTDTEVTLYQTEAGDLIGADDGRRYVVAAVDRLAALEAVAEAAEDVCIARYGLECDRAIVVLDAALARLRALDAGGEA